MFIVDDVVYLVNLCIISIILDIADCILGIIATGLQVAGLLTGGILTIAFNFIFLFWEAFMVFAGVLLWGKVGFVHVWEFLPFDAADGFVPTLSIEGLYARTQMGGEEKLPESEQKVIEGEFEVLE